MYAKARKGIIKDFTGVGSIFEIPEDYNMVIYTEKETLEESVKKTKNFLKDVSFFK
jgi:adenylylsulfate kinase